MNYYHIANRPNVDRIWEKIRIDFVNMIIVPKLMLPLRTMPRQSNIYIGGVSFFQVLWMNVEKDA